eukprot:CAMPEP_0206305438 /NCGR_PEP_ID=MMETSP0106_2-20121207/10263_1 /ASSEMBLY_ACC=CAM_ASM_000206 /TAXON_ID=81532 /ORGANISM="Acanthoeca-like sp., Strain 10tr" /LENGTH=231 /DNA_ID=CAMNT_0053736285 /DNA_START=115 /DNA_END=808 /DNA_ORIENTATION=-
MRAQFPSGFYWLRYQRTTYRAYCFNTATRGWQTAAGGGWEIVHSQIGGHGLPNTAISNANLRGAPNVAASSGLDMPWIADSSRGNISTQRSLMAPAWAQRGTENGVQWMKFAVKIQGNSPRGQDNIMMQLPSNMNLQWFFSGSGLLWQLPHDAGTVTVSINNQTMGRTNQAVFFSGQNVGLANRDNDQCGQSSRNYITTNQRTSFTRIDGGTTDNSIRHLISYSDTSTGLS